MSGPNANPQKLLWGTALNVFWFVILRLRAPASHSAQNDRIKGKTVVSCAPTLMRAFKTILPLLSPTLFCGFLLVAALGCAAPNAPAAPQNEAQSPQATVDLSGEIPVDLINDPKTFARRVVQEKHRQRDAEQARRSQELIAKGIMPPPPSSDQRRVAWDKSQQSLEENGEYATMIEFAREQQKLVPDDASGLFYEGKGLFYQGDYAGAIAAWEKTLALDGGFKSRVSAQLERARALQKRWGAQPPLVVVESDVARERTAWIVKGRTMLGSRDYDGIEAQVAALTKSEQATAAGQWFLTDFYRGLSQTAGDREDDAAWDELQRRLQNWRIERPASWLARLALAQTWMHRASLARGSGWAKDVTPAQTKLMGERMNKMGVLLDEGGDLKKQLEISPLFAEVLADWALLSGLDTATYDELIGVVNGKFPTYWGAYEDAAYRLIPRWYGTPGEWESYAASMANRLAQTHGAAQGDALYARMVSRVALAHWSEGSIWDSSGANWPRTKRGMQEMLREHPDSLSVATVLFEFAYQKQDFECARATLGTIGGRVNRGFYGGNARDFALHRIEVLERP